LQERRRLAVRVQALLQGPELLPEPVLPQVRALLV